MVTPTIPIALAAAIVSAGAATGATWLAFHQQLCPVQAGPDAAELDKLKKQHEDYFKPQTYDMTHGQEMKPRW